MTEHAEDPAAHAGNKIVQYVSLATMAAEALAQRAQQRAAAAAATDERATAALRAQQTGQRNTARLQWQSALDPRRAAHASLGEAGLAWAASQSWREVDPEAALASDRALERLRELRPDVMARFDRLTGDGLDQVEAMRRVALFLDRPAAREHDGVVRQQLAESQSEVEAPLVEVGPDAGLQAAADSAARAAGNERSQVAARTAVVDDAGTAGVDERLDADALADPHRRAAADQSSRAAALHSASERAADLPGDVPLVASARTPPQLAHDAYPEPLTGEVLAAGKVKPRTPDQTAPAAVRSAGLATAARATGRAGGRAGGRGR